MHVSTGVSLACLALAIGAYGCSSLLLATGARSVLGAAYLAGLGCQGVAFVAAFVARAQLPLVTVQAAVAASVAVTALLGAALGRWRLTARDGLALLATVGGIALVTAAADPGPASRTTAAPLLVSAAVGVAACAGLHPRVGAAVLGSCAGLAYGSSAVAARALAGHLVEGTGPGQPLTIAVAVVLLIAGVAVGQALLTVAFRRASAGAAATSSTVIGPVSALYVASTVWPALAGLAWMGDRLHAGGLPTAAAGVVLALGGAAWLSRHEQPG